MMFGSIFNAIFELVGWREKRDKYFDNYPQCAICKGECDMFYAGVPYCLKCARELDVL